ncbi:hypothetical protein OPV22_004154 [Ensete ventricosum]|uniref:Uncharacterized protein n=1 Tax=Ensete ventricosum TaxID=4639 RepID=A0AAV8S2L8_ENSVE|nr:hypothetical protein OPV22_004154 [Ensete ventricosum]
MGPAAAAPIGALAACVVLFVPLGMTGWHLSRNKVLLFCCALVAVAVHLAPHLPALSLYLPLHCHHQLPPLPRIQFPRHPSLASISHTSIGIKNVIRREPRAIHVVTMWLRKEL